MNLSKHLNTRHFYPYCILQQVTPRLHCAPHEVAYLPVLFGTCCLLGSLRKKHWFETIYHFFAIQVSEAFLLYVIIDDIIET